MDVTWIMQTNMGSLSDIQKYVQGVKNSGANVLEVKYIPFSEILPKFHALGPVVAYGSVNFIKEIQKVLPHAVFGNHDTFTYESWAKNYGSMLLNSPEGVELTTIEKFSLDKRNPEDDIFVRPQHDTKSLVGAVWIASDFKKWCIEAVKGDFAEVNKDTPIVIAQPYGIEAEWRLFIVDNKVVGASQYKKNGKMYKQEGAPQDILDFAKKVISKCTPAPAYTLDLCHSAGNCYIVEVQGFNSAGHYECDINKVAIAVNEIVKKLWKEKNAKYKI